MMKRSGLSTEPWWTPTFTSNSSVYPAPTRKPCRVSWQLDTSLAAAWQQRLRLLCLCLGWSQTENCRLTQTVWWGRPQSSPGFSWPAVLAWDCGSCPFPMHAPFPCRGRQWNSAPSQRVPCHGEWLQLWGHGSWKRPCHWLLASSPPLLPDGPGALPTFICEIAFLTISIVIGMGRSSTGGW